MLRHRDDERVDDWYWLRDRDDPAVRAHLEAENAYIESVLAPLAPLRAQIYDEITARVVETDVTAPIRRGPFQYFTRTREGLQYSLHCRRAAGAPAPRAAEEPGTVAGEEVLLDENALAETGGYFALRGLALAPGQGRMAYAVDRSGGEVARLRFRDLASAADLPDEIDGVYYGLGWADDDTLLYVRPDAALRPFQVWRHRLGTEAADDALVFEEQDERYYVSVHRARSGAVLLIESESKLTTEVWLVDTADPEAPAQVVAPREEGVEYHVEHHRGPGRDDLYIVTNADGAVNFELVRAPLATPGRAHWEVVVAPDDDVRLEGVSAFAGHVVLSERAEGLARVRALDLGDGSIRTVTTGDDVATTWLGSTPDFDTTVIRLGATSLVLPTSDYDHDLATGTTTLVRRQPVAGYDPDRYRTDRVWAQAPDGTRVPISLVHRDDGPAGAIPFLLYGYGAYEISIDPTFSISRLSLLDRGAGYAIAHVRGGGELGRRWYEEGRLEHKRTTFTDFVACGQHLLRSGRAARLVARGGSAGGLTVGAALNLAPDLWSGVVAEVPFVDCLTTMLDASLPLTITEWEEWGNPDAEPELYDYLRRYSPYDTVAAVPYPTVLATAGVNDPRVQYWEPAKWVQQLRARTTGTSPILLRTELGAGHHGPSGRYDSWREEAFMLAFVASTLGLDPPG